MASEAWEEEGILENMLGTGVDLLYYLDRTRGVFHYKLLVDNQLDAERRLTTADPDERRILNGVKQQWEYAQTAKALNDTIAQFAFTWRGLRLLFPYLPEEPMNTEG